MFNPCFREEPSFCISIASPHSRSQGSNAVPASPRPSAFPTTIQNLSFQIQVPLFAPNPLFSIFECFLSAEETNPIEVSIDIDEVLRINDKDYSITFSTYFNVEWRERRLNMFPSFGASLRAGDNSTEQVMVPTDVELVDDLWVPNIFIYNLKTFKVIDVLSKLSGLWIDTDKNVLYSQATLITTICPMRFDKFPLDTQTCQFRVGSYSYDSSKLLFTTKNAGKKKFD